MVAITAKLRMHWAPIAHLRKRCILKAFPLDSTMKSSNLAVLLNLAIFPACLFAEGAVSAPAPVAIYMSFDGDRSDLAIEAMQREVEALTKPGGLHLHWRLLDADRSGETFSDLVVVKFRGKCNMEGIQFLFSELGPDAEGGPLGSTKTANGQVLPFSELQCDRIRHSIAPLAIGSSREEREALLGRSLGRVLAHELFHIFANTEQHGREGVAKTRYSRKDLAADSFAFDAKDARRIERH